MFDSELAILIPAIKKNVAFPDDLIKKLAGITLIERVIQLALQLKDNRDVYILTDSLEISLFCKKYKVNCFIDKKLHATYDAVREFFAKELQDLINFYDDILILSPYSPMLTKKLLQEALKYFSKTSCDFLQPVVSQKNAFFNHKRKLEGPFLMNSYAELQCLLSSFEICKSWMLLSSNASAYGASYHIDDYMIEINSYRDWWVCEKLIKCKKIFFRVIGNEKVGMGHIYRALTIAHEVTDHEIVFICEKKDGLVVEKIAGLDYLVIPCEPEEMIDFIIGQSPDILINDVLDTSSYFMQRIKSAGIKQVNFEDKGDGAKIADVVINALYTGKSGGKTLYGENYFLLREEFYHVSKTLFKQHIKNILIVFGATDENNITFQVLNSIKDLCISNKITIHIITGPGYRYFDLLESLIASMKDHLIIYHEHNIPCISHVLERVDFAITANGRTKYEIFQMNIPSIVISQNIREHEHLNKKHLDCCKYLGVYSSRLISDVLPRELAFLLSSEEIRLGFYNAMLSIDYRENKKRVINLITKLLESNFDVREEDRSTRPSENVVFQITK